MITFSGLKNIECRSGLWKWNGDHEFSFQYEECDVILRPIWSLLLKEWTEKMEDRKDDKERKIIENGRKLVEHDDMKPRRREIQESFK